MNKKGFTLVELLVVIGIIGILSTLAVISLNNAREKSRDAKRVSDIKQIQTALEMYFVEVDTYPVQGTDATPIELGGASAQALSSGAGFSSASGVSDTVFMGQVPSNPTPGGASYSYQSTNADGTECTSGDCLSYKITFTLEGQTGSLTAGDHTAVPSGIQ